MKTQVHVRWKHRYMYDENTGACTMKTQVHVHYNNWRSTCSSDVRAKIWAGTSFWASFVIFYFQTAVDTLLMKLTTTIHDSAYAVVAEYVKVGYRSNGCISLPGFLPGDKILQLDVDHPELSHNSVQVVSDEGKGGCMSIVLSPDLIWHVYRFQYNTCDTESDLCWGWFWVWDWD